MNRKYTLLLAVWLLAVALLISDITGIDRWFQDFFYNSATNSWLVPRSEPLPRVLFYHAPKILLITLASWLLLSLVFPAECSARRFLSRRSPRELIYLLVCLGLFPAMIGQLKSTTGLHSPYELTRYGGQHAYRTNLSDRPSDPAKLGRSFPAGHASGGFALLGLWFVARNRREQINALLLGLAAGWAMGLYQTFNGAHFLSHTVVTMILAWIFTLGFALAFRLPVLARVPKQKSEPALALQLKWNP